MTRAVAPMLPGNCVPTRTTPQDERVIDMSTVAVASRQLDGPLPAELDVQLAAAEDGEFLDLEEVARPGDIDVRQAALVEFFPDLLHRRVLQRQVQNDDPLALLAVGD